MPEDAAPLSPRDGIEAYRGAWERSDAAAAASLFAGDARYWSSPFSEPHVGRDAIHDYWSSATDTQRDLNVVMGWPLEDEKHAVVEWWTTWNDTVDGSITLPGVLVL